MDSSICNVCKRKKKADHIFPAEAVLSSTAELIRQKHANWTEDSTICHSCLSDFRAQQVRDLLKEEKGRLSALEKEVVASIADQELISENPNQEIEKESSLGDRVADKVAEFGGSWKFIIAFCAFLVFWMTLNSIQLLAQPFDPFPYILLNLVLSCITAMQAPIIMMSQNRQAAKDRIKAELQYQVNLKAELQTRQTMRRLDQFMTQQWQRFIEIQEIQSQMEKGKRR